MTEEKETTEEQRNLVQVGDLIVASSKSTIQDCTKEIKKLLRDEMVASFLNNSQSPLKKFYAG